MKQKTAEAMHPIVEAYAQYKGSKKAFCLEHGLASHTLDYWRRKFGEPSSKASAFVALELRDVACDRTIELYYPNGVRAVVPLEIPLQILQNLIKIVE